MKEIIITSIGVLVAIIFIITGVKLKIAVNQLQNSGARTTGTVVGFESKTRADPSRKAAYKRIQFKTTEGKTIEFESKINSISNASEGTSVPVLYDPTNPENAVIDTFAERDLAWILTLSIGAVLLIVFGTVLTIKLV